jgi:hypothetical protein
MGRQPDMATKPTRQQQQACDHFAEALILITEGARLDGKGSFAAADLNEVVDRLAKASSFQREEIVARALERRGRSLALRPGTADLLALLEGEVTPLEMLLLPDDAFREWVARMEEELGEV